MTGLWIMKERSAGRMFSSISLLKSYAINSFFSFAFRNYH